jgi:hypothetical protein
MTLVRANWLARSALAMKNANMESAKDLKEKPPAMGMQKMTTAPHMSSAI